MNPCISRGWPGFTVVYRYGESTYTILVDNQGGVSRGVASVEVDGRQSTDGWIELVDDGLEHSVKVILGS
jgi:cyclic beta-1,2-glucan synthetase